MTLKRIFFSKCLSDHSEQLLPIETSLKNQVKVLKRGLTQNFTEKRHNDGPMMPYVRNMSSSKCFSGHAK